MRQTRLRVSQGGLMREVRPDDEDLIARIRSEPLTASEPLGPRGQMFLNINLTASTQDFMERMERLANLMVEVFAVPPSLFGILDGVDDDADTGHR